MHLLLSRVRKAWVWQLEHYESVLLVHYPHEWWQGSQAAASLSKYLERQGQVLEDITSTRLSDVLHVPQVVTVLKQVKHLKLHDNWLQSAEIGLVYAYPELHIQAF